MSSQIPLQTLRTVGFPRAPMGGPDLDLQPAFFLRAPRRPTAAAGMKTTGRHTQ